MTEYYSKVNIFSFGAKYKGPVNAAMIEGNGRASSNDLISLRNISEKLVWAVDRNNERVYRLIE
jgi:hypothetical protein